MKIADFDTSMFMGALHPVYQRFYTFPWYATPRKEWRGKCSCCDQHLSVQCRKFYNRIGRSLMFLYRLHILKPGEQAFHIRHLKVSDHGGAFGQTIHWGLAQTMESATTDKRWSGMWRITPNGKLFCELKVSIPSHVVVGWNNTLLGFAGDPITMVEALQGRNPFDYGELTGWSPASTPA